MNPDDLRKKLEIKSEPIVHVAYDPLTKKNIKLNVSNHITLNRAVTFFNKEPETIEWIRGFNEHSVFYDIGANIGVFSLFAAVIKNCKVFSFEPNALNFGELVKNVNLNNTLNIIPYCIGLSDTTEITKLFLKDLTTGSSGHSIKNSVDYNLNPVQRLNSQGILSITLDDLTQNWTLPKPEHVKIDVDGIEHKIIEGASQLLSTKTLKSILVELNVDKTPHREIIQKMEDNNFWYDSKAIESRRKDKGFNKGEANYIFSRGY